MFNIGVGELLIVLLVAFVIVGPDDLPKVARWLGRQFRRLRALMRQIKEETGWNEVEKEVREIRRDVRDTVREMDVTAELRDAAKDVRREIDEASRDVSGELRRADAQARADLNALDDDLRAAASQEQTNSEEAKP